MRDAVGDKGRVVCARGANVTDDAGVVGYLNLMNWDKPEIVQDKRPPGDMIAEAVKAARSADVIVVAVGESRGMSHEASSRHKPVHCREARRPCSRRSGRPASRWWWY
ncbi:hypothetical protein ACU4GD_22900 [Cupriavidus basilensis]